MRNLNPLNNRPRAAARIFWLSRLFAAALVGLTAACAGGAVDRAGVMGKGGRPSAADAARELERALDALYLRRAEFLPFLCKDRPATAFYAEISGNVYRVPLDSFVMARLAPRARITMGTGCPERPMVAATLTMDAGQIAADHGMTLADGDAQATIIASMRLQSLSERTARILTLADQGVCDDAPADPSFVRCNTKEAVFSNIEDTTYFIAVTADAPAINGAPFAIRCVSRQMRRPCGVLDRLSPGALLAIDYGPEDRTEPSALIPLHDVVKRFALELDSGRPI